jgi:site-specific recombinase XerD
MNHLPENSRTSNVLDPSDGFKLYLKSQAVSPATIKNYLSDFNHFWGWLILTLKKKLISFNLLNPATIVAHLTPEIISEYKSFLLSNQVPVKTVNRRLSTLRQFGQFCLSQSWLTTNPTKGVGNVGLEKTEDKRQKTEKILDQFKNSLEKEKVSPITTKNYLSDLRHFLSWIEAT